MRTSTDVRTVRASAGVVRVRDTGGAGTPVLLVHSLLTDPDLYAWLVPLLTDRGLRCIVPELPLGAHELPLGLEADLSPDGLAQLMVEVLDVLDLPRAHVVGVDTGGALAQLLMADHRDRVDRVVLTACDAYDAFPPASIRWLVQLMTLPGALALTAQLGRFSAVRRLVSLRPLTHAGVSDETARQWFAPLRRAAVRFDVVKAVAGMSPVSTQRAAAANADFPRPVLVAWGDDDRVFPRRLGERLVADLPDARLVTLSNCAAFAALDQPELLARLIAEHVAVARPTATR